jgi:hypothetical protein
MKIRLKPFEELSSISYDRQVPVLYQTQTVGVCDVIRNPDGSHHGVLTISNPTYLNKYVYYLDSNRFKDISPIYYFSGLLLTDEERKDGRTCLLKELAI